MENSHRFFSNKECKYYPCHEMEGELNCLFCYCPLYPYECIGNYRMIEKDGRKVKSCRECTFPHQPGNYDRINELIKTLKKREDD